MSCQRDSDARELKKLISKPKTSDFDWSFGFKKKLKNFEKRLKCLKDYNPYSLECRKLRRQIYEKQAELEERISLLNSAKEKYLLVQKDYEKAMSHFNKIAEGKNN